MGEDILEHGSKTKLHALPIRVVRALCTGTLNMPEAEAKVIAKKDALRKLDAYVSCNYVGSRCS